jgi:hypothetical protein
LAGSRLRRKSSRSSLGHNNGPKIRPTGKSIEPRGTQHGQRNRPALARESVWEVGRIYETHGGPDNLRWFWSTTVNGPMTRSGRVWRERTALCGAEAFARSAGTTLSDQQGRKLIQCRDARHSHPEYARRDLRWFWSLTWPSADALRSGGDLGRGG